MFRCYLCEWAFRAAGDLRRHMTTHSGHRPYACSLCTQRFTRANSLRQHERRRHSDTIV